MFNVVTRAPDTVTVSTSRQTEIVNQVIIEPVLTETQAHSGTVIKNINHETFISETPDNLVQLVDNQNVPVHKETPDNPVKLTANDHRQPDVGSLQQNRPKRQIFASSCGIGIMLQMSIRTQIHTYHQSMRTEKSNGF